MTDMIDVTGCDLRELVKAAYDLSRPQGMGYLHYVEGPLDEASVDEIVSRESPRGHVRLSMDYVKGRAVKLTVFKDDEKLVIRSNWFDHSDELLNALLRRIGIAKT